MTDSIPLSQLQQGVSFRFDNLGDTAAGRIISMTERQQTDIATGQLRFFGDGVTPRMQWVINLEQPSGDVVTLWARAGNYEAARGSGSSMLSAIAAAVRTAGAAAVEIGGELAVAYTGESKPKPGQNPAKLYTAQYKPPAPQAIPVDLFGES